MNERQNVGDVVIVSTEQSHFWNAFGFAVDETSDLLNWSAQLMSVLQFSGEVSEWIHEHSIQLELVHIHLLLGEIVLLLNAFKSLSEEHV